MDPHISKVVKKRKSVNDLQVNSSKRMKSSPVPSTSSPLPSQPHTSSNSPVLSSSPMTRVQLNNSVAPSSPLIPSQPHNSQHLRTPPASQFRLARNVIPATGSVNIEVVEKLKKFTGIGDKSDYQTVKKFYAQHKTHNYELDQVFNLLAKNWTIGSPEIYWGSPIPIPKGFSEEQVMKLINPERWKKMNQVTYSLSPQYRILLGPVKTQGFTRRDRIEKIAKQRLEREKILEAQRSLKSIGSKEESKEVNIMASGKESIDSGKPKSQEFITIPEKSLLNVTETQKKIPIHFDSKGTQTDYQLNGYKAPGRDCVFFNNEDISQTRRSFSQNELVTSRIRDPSFGTIRNPVWYY